MQCRRLGDDTWTKNSSQTRLNHSRLMLHSRMASYSTALSQADSFSADARAFAADAQQSAHIITRATALGVLAVAALWFQLGGFAERGAPPWLPRIGYVARVEHHIDDQLLVLLLGEEQLLQIAPAVHCVPPHGATAAPPRLLWATQRTLYGPSLSRSSELTSRKRFSSVMCLKWYLHERRALTRVTR